MTFEAFTSSLTEPQPPASLPKTLQALWYDGKNAWDTAHDIAQDIGSPDGSWIHAYLHRKEGDTGNAGYWYRRAGKPMPSVSLQREWEQIVRELLDR
jgi:phage major head subunit gpT-like protein